MDVLTKYFEDQNYKAVIHEVHKEKKYTADLRKIRFLAAAHYYLRSFKDTIEAIDIIHRFDQKLAYEMYIDTYISLGTDKKKHWSMWTNFLPNHRA